MFTHHATEEQKKKKEKRSCERKKYFTNQKKNINRCPPPSHRPRIFEHARNERGRQEGMRRLATETAVPLPLSYARTLSAHLLYLSTLRPCFTISFAIIFPLSISIPTTPPPSLFVFHLSPQSLLFPPPLRHTSHKVSPHTPSPTPTTHRCTRSVMGTNNKAHIFKLKKDSFRMRVVVCDEQKHKKYT